MAYDATKPADDEFLSVFPAEMREQLRAIIQDAIVNALTVNGYSPGNLNGNIPLSNGNLNTNLNADKLDGHDATYFSADGHVHAAATQSTNGFMSNTDKTKLDGVATGAEVNQNSFSNVAVGTETIQADNKTDTLTLAAGANIAITPDATNDKVTIAVTGTVPAAAAADRATADAAGNVIVDTYLPKTGGTISGDVTAQSFNGTLHGTADNADGINITHGNEITLSGPSSYGDCLWLGWRAPKKVTEYKFGDGTSTGGFAAVTAQSFNGALHGTADNASKLSGYSLNTNTEQSVNWGLVPFVRTDGVMEVGKYIDWHATASGNVDYTSRFTAEANGTVTVGTINGRLNGTADNSDQLNGYTAAQLISKVAGRSTPTLTSILDGCYDGNGNKINKIVNASTGISGYDTGDIHLTQSYKNFDKILVVHANDDTNYEKYVLWDTWQLAYAFSHGWRIDLANGSDAGADWYVYTAVQAGTSTHPLSTDTIWYVQTENSVMVDIIGVNY